MFAVWESYASSPNKPRRVTLTLVSSSPHFPFPQCFGFAGGQKFAAAAQPIWHEAPPFLRPVRQRWTDRGYSIIYVYFHHVQANSTKRRHTVTNTLFHGTDRVTGGLRGISLPLVY